jgi:glycine oxidase
MSLGAGNKSTADVVVIGAGLIGLAIALELHDRGAHVTVLESSRALSHASTAAAGMLAVDDPHNPPALLPLSRLSAHLYPTFLRRLHALSGLTVSFQTETTLQYAPDGTVLRLAEKSLDPRQLATAVLAAVRSTPIRLLDQTHIASISPSRDRLSILTSTGLQLHAPSILYTTGAWTQRVLQAEGSSPVPIVPRKGQMLRVQLPAGLRLEAVHRNDRIYIVPRTLGPQAGTALIGATIEDAGFDTSVHNEDLARLRNFAAHLVQDLRSETAAPLVEAWAGLRPATPDALPILSATPGARQFIATGHFRNGILLAPATAALMADLLTGNTPQLDLTPFRAGRFTC